MSDLRIHLTSSIRMETLLDLEIKSYDGKKIIFVFATGSITQLASDLERTEEEIKGKIKGCLICYCGRMLKLKPKYLSCCLTDEKAVVTASEGITFDTSLIQEEIKRESGFPRDYHAYL